MSCFDFSEWLSDKQVQYILEMEEKRVFVPLPDDGDTTFKGLDRYINVLIEPSDSNAQAQESDNDGA